MCRNQTQINAKTIGEPCREHHAKTLRKLSKSCAKTMRKLCEYHCQKHTNDAKTMRQLCETILDIYAITMRKLCEHYADIIKNTQTKRRRYHLLTGIINMCFFPLAAKFKQTELKLCPSLLLFRMPSVAAENSNSSMSLYQTANNQNPEVNLIYAMYAGASWFMAEEFCK